MWPREGLEPGFPFWQPEWAQLCVRFAECCQRFPSPHCFQPRSALPTTAPGPRVHSTVRRRSSPCQSPRVAESTAHSKSGRDPRLSPRRKLLAPSSDGVRPPRSRSRRFCDPLIELREDRQRIGGLREDALVDMPGAQGHMKELGGVCQTCRMQNREKTETGFAIKKMG